MSIPILIKFIFCFQSSSQYLLFRQENNELLMFTLKQLDQVTFHSNCYGSAPGIIEILEEEFLDRVSVLFYATFWGRLFVLAGSRQKFRSHAKGGTPEHPNIYTRKNAQVVTSPQTSCYQTVCSQAVNKLCSHCLFPVCFNKFETSCLQQACYSHDITRMLQGCQHN